MSVVAIRSMLPEDWAQVSEIYGQGIAGHQATFAQEIPPYEQWDGEHHQHSRLVAEQEGQIIGWAALTPSFARQVYAGVAEVSLYIRNDNQRKGVGKALLLALEDISQQHGIWTLEALIFDDNLASLALFNSCGYTQLGTRQRLGYDQALQRWRNVVLLEKRSTRDFPTS